MTGSLDLEGLPGAELIARGRDDLVSGRESVESLLVRIGWPRLAAAGVLAGVPERGPLSEDAEIVLYRMLEQRHGRAAYTEYQALLRRLVSFENAADHRRSTAAV
jgi:hypothetical protein